VLKTKSIIILLVTLVTAFLAGGIHQAFAATNFTLDATPNPVTNIQAGMNGTSTITVRNNSTSLDTVTLTNTTVTSGLSCSLNPTIFVLNGGESQPASLSCKSPTVGSFLVNVNGTSTIAGLKNGITVTFIFKVLVNLDASNTGQTDAIVSRSATQPKSFRVGAVVNASNTNQVSNVYGWQFEIDYNATAFAPQGDPDPFSSYPDGAANTVLFGAQTTAGTVNWAGLASATLAFGSFQVSTAGSVGQLQVFFTMIAPNPSVILSARTLLATVSFELLNKPTTPQAFTVTNVVFADQNSNIILTTTQGLGGSETITNSPPVARFTSSPLPKGDSSCVPVTGFNCSAYAFRLDGSASSDLEDVTIVNPGGFFWDFGDGAQDLATTGSIVVHDYVIQGQYAVSLRVQDSQGATGSARSSSGSVINNLQPSHTSQTLVAANGFSISASPGDLSIGPNSLGPIGNSTITLTSVTSGFSGTISLSATSKPTGPNAPNFSFNTTQVTLTPGGTVAALLTVSITSNTPHLDYNVTISATIGQIINNVTILIVPTTMSVQPTAVTGVSKGNTFSVNINTSAANLFSWQFHLDYNNTILSASVSSVAFGPYWLAQSAQQKAFLFRQINQTGGHIVMAVSLLDKTVAFTGNGTLATITFTVNADGITQLGLSNNYLINAVGLGQSLSFSQKNGVFCNMSCLTHDVALTKIRVSAAAVNVGSPVTVNATISNIGLNLENITVTYQAGGVTFGYRHVLLAPGNSTTITAVWDTANLAPKDYTITVQASINGNTDGNAANNTASQTLALNSPSLGDSTLLIAIIAIIAAVAVAVSILLIRRRSAAPVTAA